MHVSGPLITRSDRECPALSNSTTFAISKKLRQHFNSALLYSIVSGYILLLVLNLPNKAEMSSSILLAPTGGADILVKCIISLDELILWML